MERLEDVYYLAQKLGDIIVRNPGLIPKEPAKKKIKDTDVEVVEWKPEHAANTPKTRVARKGRKI